ncbi:MAG: hypothetical protein DWQ01_01670 [Planctomycetota bacterium]|nr:MAG: hypothetical protein DWQ01_01670 [Planctomycetota bacterium]
MKSNLDQNQGHRCGRLVLQGLSGCFGLFLLAACSSSPSKSWSAALEYQDQEIETVTADSSVLTGSAGEVDLRDVNRSRVGVLIQQGHGDFHWRFGAHSEEFLEVFDLYGVQAGLGGFLPFAGEEEPGFGFAWDLDLSVSFGSGDYQTPGGPMNSSLDLLYSQTQGEAAIGWRYGDFLPMAGLYAALFRGQVDIAGSSDQDFDAFSVSGMIGADYQSPENPFLAHFRAYLGGDVSGFSIAGGFLF